MDDDGATPATGHVLPIRFTGSGSEYFRIWIVNLLLTLVTLGIYYPWAKVRRLRYFYGNTVVGDHTLDFHGDPKRMLRGFVLVGVLVALYSLAGKVSPVAGLIALVIVAGVWPALFRASMRFRLANTSWRGLRFRFTADMAGAYKAMLPLYLPALLVGVIAVVSGVRGGPASRAATLSVMGSTLAPVLLFPAFWWLLKKYQHDHFALGQVQTELRTGVGSFYAVFLKMLAVSVLTLMAGMAAAFAVAGVGWMSGLGLDEHRKGAAAAVLGIVVIVVFVYGGLALVMRPYATSRLQNLIWGRTESNDLRFTSDLRFWPLVGLTLKNWLLILVTLGLYWPFASIAAARMRLQAVAVQTRIAPDALVNGVLVREDDASGDAAGDLFGIDIGW